MIGNMLLVISLHSLQCLDLMLRWGAEPDSLFRRVPASEVECSDDSDTPVAPTTFYDMVVKAEPAMKIWRVSLERVLRRLLSFSSSVSLDDRLADYCTSESNWCQLKAVAGSKLILCT